MRGKPPGVFSFLQKLASDLGLERIKIQIHAVHLEGRKYFVFIVLKVAKCEDDMESRETYQ